MWCKMTETTIAFQGGMFQQQLESVNYQNPPWSLEYPELVHIFQDHPCIPVYNVVANNTYCGGTFIDISAEQAKEWLDTVANNSMKCWVCIAACRVTFWTWDLDSYLANLMTYAWGL